MLSRARGRVAAVAWVRNEEEPVGAARTRAKGRRDVIGADVTAGRRRTRRAIKRRTPALGPVRRRRTGHFEKSLLTDDDDDDYFAPNTTHTHAHTAGTPFTRRPRLQHRNHARRTGKAQTVFFF